MVTTKFIEPIPDRRRTRFAPNGGPRPTAAQRRQAQRGITAAREALAAAVPDVPKHEIAAQMASTDVDRARRGIEQARQSLALSSGTDQPKDHAAA